MSLRYRDSSGNETIVSGLTPGGDIEAGAVAERSGTFNISVGAGSYAAYTITFDEPMPDDDYIVSFYGPSTSQGMQFLFFNSDQQTANGFIVMVNNTYNTAISRTGIRYKAVKTYSVQHAAQNAEDIANIKAVIPSTASSTNQLTPKKYVDDADTALDGRVSDLEDLIPNNASVTNQLVTKAEIDNVYTKTEVDTKLDNKQDTLTFDNEPTAGSSNPVKSNGVKDALDAKQNTLTFDTAPTAGSNNPVTSGGVKSAIDAITSTPVDVVENSNMHAVTSNAVYDHLFGLFQPIEGAVSTNTNIDLNNCTTGGFANFLISPVNPNSCGSYGYLLVLRYGNTSNPNLCQVHFPYHSGDQFAIRCRFSGNWTNWKLYGAI